jgi:hypothetical protein
MHGIESIKALQISGIKPIPLVLTLLSSYFNGGTRRFQILVRTITLSDCHRSTSRRICNHNVT